MKKYYFFFEEGSKINQLICALLINFIVFNYGASIGWMSPMTLLLQSENSPRGKPLTDNEVSWMGAIVYLAGLPSNFLLAWMADKIGRKKTLFFMSIMATGSWVIKLLSTETWALLVARSFVGVVMACYVPCPLYTKEISESSIRGMLGTLVVLSQTAGNLFLYVIGDMLSYHNILWVCLSLPVLHLILFTMMPESPSYLIKKGEFDKAAAELAWLRCREKDDIAVVNELDQLKKEQLKDEESQNFALKAIVSDKILFKAFQIALVVTLAREFCGTIPVLNFAGDIFTMASEGSGLTLSPNQQAIMLGAVQFIGASLTFGTVEKAGRKTLLFITSLISGLSMMTLATWFLVRLYGIQAPASIPVTMLCLSIFCDAFGLQSMSVIIASEIFSFKYRSTVMAAAMTLGSTSCVLQMIFFKPIANTIGIHASFYIFGGVCLFTALYTILVVPETKNKSLDEIYGKLRSKENFGNHTEDEKQKETIA